MKAGQTPLSPCTTDELPRLPVTTTAAHDCNQSRSHSNCDRSQSLPKASTVWLQCMACQRSERPITTPSRPTVVSPRLSGKQFQYGCGWTQVVLNLSVWGVVDPWCVSTNENKREKKLWNSTIFGLLVGYLTSQQHASVSQGRICSDNFTCCHTEIEVADQTFLLTQSQYTDTGPTSPSTDPISPGPWQSSHWSANV